MNIEVRRTIFESDHTVSDMYINGEYFCKVLEDVDRGLTSATPLEEIRKIKVMHKTAIPKGTYRLVITFSDKYKRMMPLLMNVPGFMGIRIHPGNTADHSSGCLLLGDKYDPTRKAVLNSVKTFTQFLKILTKHHGKEKITITIK